MTTKNKPGIHLYKQHNWKPVKNGKGLYLGKPEWYWHITASNGRIIARSSETYTRKSGAVKSIATALFIFGQHSKGKYYDHSKKDSPIQSYL